MSITQTIAPLFGANPATASCENTGKASVDAPVAKTSPAGNFLPGLRPVENEVEAYFGDAFAGPANTSIFGQTHGPRKAA